MSAKTYYWMVGVILTILFGQAFFFLTKSGGDDPDPTHYVYMDPEARLSAVRSLHENMRFLPQVVEPDYYFSELKRYEDLKDAIHRAQIEGTAATKRSAGYRGETITVPANPDDIVEVQRTEDDFVHAAQQRLTGDTAVFMAAQKRWGFNVMRDHSRPMHPMLLWAWAMFYFVGMFFAFWHFMIRIDALGGVFWLSTSDIRLYLWLSIWPIGVFRYPKAIDVRQQWRRAKHLATFVMFWSLSAVGACAGKIVKTEPTSKKKSAPYALHVNASTSTLNDYMGLDGGVFHPAPVQQLVVTVTMPKNFYLGVWHSASIGQSNLVPNYGREIDVLGGWGTSFGKFQVSVDGAYVGVVPLVVYAGDVIQAVERVGREFDIGRGQTLTPYLSFTEAWPTTNNTPRRGFFYREGLQWGWQNKSWSGGANAELTHDSGAFGFKPGFLAQGRVAISKQLNKHLRTEVPFRWSMPLNTGDRQLSFETGLTLAVSK